MKFQLALLLLISSSFVAECSRAKSHLVHQRSGRIGDEARSRLHAGKKRQDPQMATAGQAPQQQGQDAQQSASTQAIQTTAQMTEQPTTTQAMLNPQVAITTESTPQPAVIYMSTSAPEEGSGEESGSGSGSGSGIEESTTQFVQTSQAPVSPTAQPMTTTTMAYGGPGGPMAVTFTTSLPIPVGPSATVTPQYTTFESPAVAPQNVQTYSQTFSQAPVQAPAAGSMTAPVAAPVAPAGNAGTYSQPTSADDVTPVTTTGVPDATQAWTGETPIEIDNTQDATPTVVPTHKRKLANRRSHHKGYTASEHHKASTHKKGKTSHALSSSHGHLAHHKSKVIKGKRRGVVTTHTLNRISQTPDASMTQHARSDTSAVVRLTASSKKQRSLMWS